MTSGDYVINYQFRTSDQPKRDFQCVLDSNNLELRPKVCDQNNFPDWTRLAL